MADAWDVQVKKVELQAKKVEVIGQLVVELLRQNILPVDLMRGGKGMPVGQIGLAIGGMFKGAWDVIDALAPGA